MTGVYQQNSGGASRFFYTAKASKSERGAYNNHPTVKPLSLLVYLAKLTRTPTGGVILDPFAGSCTTALAAIKTGRDYIMIEQDADYVAIGQRRIDELLAQGVQMELMQ
jgi:site-specific DNA-methyltransferase (adenine-specific)